MTINLVTLRRILRTRLRDGDSIEYESDEELNDYINQAYIETLRRSKCAQITVAKTSVSGTNTYSTDYIFEPTNVWYNGVMLSKREPEEMTQLYSGWITNGSSAEQNYWWTENGRTIRIADTPNSNGKSINIRGYCVSAGMLSDTQTPELLPYGFEYMLVDFAEYLARKDRQSRSGNMEIATQALQIYEQKLAELIRMVGVR